MHIISSSQIKILYSIHINAHYILILFTEVHIISSSQKYTLYHLHRNAHYILFSEINIISSSQINTINPSPQICKLYPLLRYTQYNILSDRHTISSFQMYKLYPLHRNTHYILYSETTLQITRTCCSTKCRHKIEECYIRYCDCNAV